MNKKIFFLIALLFLIGGVSAEKLVIDISYSDGESIGITADSNEDMICKATHIYNDLNVPVLIPDSQQWQLDYTWYNQMNGATYSSTVLPASLTSPGDNWECRVCMRDTIKKCDREQIQIRNDDYSEIDEGNVYFTPSHYFADDTGNLECHSDFASMTSVDYVMHNMDTGDVYYDNVITPDRLSFGDVWECAVSYDVPQKITRGYTVVDSAISGVASDIVADNSLSILTSATRQATCNITSAHDPSHYSYEWYLSSNPANVLSRQRIYSPSLGDLIQGDTLNCRVLTYYHRREVSSSFEPIMANAAPTLSVPQVNRVSSGASSVFNFTVTYYDSDNNAPWHNGITDRLVLEIDESTNYTMTKVDTSDDNYENGALFSTSIASSTFGPGFHSFRVYASDGEAEVSASGSGFTTSNIPPSLQTIDPIYVTEGEEVVVVANATDADGDAISYTISDPARFTQNHNIFRWQTESGDAGNYTFQVTADDGQSSTVQQVEVVVYAPGAGVPSVTITSPSANSIYSADQTINLVCNAYDPEDGELSGDSVSWTSSINGFLGYGDSISTNSLAIGQHTIRVTAHDSDGLINSRSVQILVSQDGEVDLSIDAIPLNGSLPLTVQFVSNSSGVFPTAYAWDFDGDGDVDSHEANPRYTYTIMHPYDYTVTLTAFYDDGTAIKRSLVISTSLPDLAPEIRWYQGDENPAVGEKVEFWAEAEGNSPFTFEWDFDGDKIADETGDEVEYSFDEEGCYDVTLTVTDVDGDSRVKKKSVCVDENDDDLFVSRINFPSTEYVPVGGELRISVLFKNRGNMDMENLRISASMNEFGIRRVLGPFDLDEGESEVKYLNLDIPGYIYPGVYDLKIEIGNNEFRRTKYRPITVYSNS